MERDVKVVLFIGAVALALALALPLVAYSMHGAPALLAETQASGYVENTTITGTVRDAHHMMLELETPEGEEVEVMLPGIWETTLPDGSKVMVAGWELAERYVEEGWNITVAGYLYEGPTCMGEDEARLIALSMESPTEGFSAILASQP